MENDKFRIDILVIPGPSKIKLDESSDWIGGIAFVEFQIELFSDLNPGVGFRWHLGFLEDQVESNQLLTDRDNIKNYIFKKSELKLKYVDNPSSQHGALLNLLLERIEKHHSRFIIIIDPDFFILKRNWIHNLLDYMENKSVAILGASYPETDCRLYYDFPTAYFSVIDLSLISINKLDYLPDENCMKMSDRTPWKSDSLPNLNGYSRVVSKNNKLNEFLFLLQSIFRWRNKQTFFRDTGWKVRKVFKNRVKHEEFLFLDNLAYEFKAEDERSLVNEVDPEFYLEKYADIKNSSMEPVYHFQNHGKKEWRQPKAFLKKNEKQYIFYLRPHLKYKFLRNIERFYSSEYSIKFIRKYTFKDLVNDHSVQEIEELTKLPNAKAFYFFNNQFVSFHLGHDYSPRDIKQIRKMIVEYIAKI